MRLPCVHASFQSWPRAPWSVAPASLALAQAPPPVSPIDQILGSNLSDNLFSTDSVILIVTTSLGAPLAVSSWPVLRSLWLRSSSTIAMWCNICKHVLGRYYIPSSCVQLWSCSVTFQDQKFNERKPQWMWKPSSY